MFSKILFHFILHNDSVTALIDMLKNEYRKLKN